MFILNTLGNHQGIVWGVSWNFEQLSWLGNLWQGGMAKSSCAWFHWTSWILGTQHLWIVSHCQSWMFGVGHELHIYFIVSRLWFEMWLLTMGSTSSHFVWASTTMRNIWFRKGPAKSAWRRSHWAEGNSKGCSGAWGGECRVRWQLSKLHPGSSLVSLV